MTIDRPSPTHHLDKLDPTSKAWLDYDELVRRDGVISFGDTRRCKPWLLACERTPEYAALRDAALDAQNRVSRLGLVLKELIYHQDGLRSAGLEDSLISREPEDSKLFRAAAHSLHTYIAKAKFDRDEQQKKLDEARAAMQAMEQAERDEKRAAHPEDYMIPTIERLEAEGKW